MDQILYFPTVLLNYHCRHIRWHNIHMSHNILQNCLTEVFHLCFFFFFASNNPGFKSWCLYGSKCCITNFWQFQLISAMYCLKIVNRIIECQCFPPIVHPWLFGYEACFEMTTCTPVSLRPQQIKWPWQLTIHCRIQSSCKLPLTFCLGESALKPLQKG